MTDEQEDLQKESKPLTTRGQRWANIPREINSVFGDEAHEVVEPKEITPEGINEQLKKSDDFDD